MHIIESVISVKSVKTDHNQQLIQMSLYQVELQEGRHRVDLHVHVCARARVCIREVRDP